MSNILTIIRIIGTIPLIYLINKNGFNIYNFIFFVFLEITDFFDGYLARKFNNVTKFGTIADGIADKFSMIALTIILLIKDIIPIWTLIIFIRYNWSYYVNWSLEYFYKYINDMCDCFIRSRNNLCV